MIEEISSIIHDLWMGWAKILLESEPWITKERKERWESCFVPYEQLSEEMKDLDRKFAKIILECIKK